MFRENNLVIGLALGITLPVLAYLAFELSFDALDAAGVSTPAGESFRFRPRTLGLLAVCCNLLPFRYYARRRMLQAMRGVFLATGIYAVIWMVYFGSTLLG